MFYKTIDNKTIFTDGRSVVINGRLVSNATDEMLVNDGWAPYVEPVDAKAIKRAEAEQFAESLKTVDFHGASIWLTPDKRSNYRCLVDAMIDNNVPEISFNGVTVTPAQAKQMLNAVEIFAARVTQTCETHIHNIDAMETDAEVEAYDVTTGYPDTIHF